MGLREMVERVTDSFSGVLSFDVDPTLGEGENVEKVIGDTALVGGLISCVQPIPWADMVILAPLHVKMTLQIGKIKGFQLEQERAREIALEVAGVASLAVTSQALIGVFKLVPVVGAVFTFPLNYAATWALGQVVDYYFESLRAGRRPSREDMQELFKEQFQVGKERGKGFDKGDIASRAEALRQRVARRDPSLVTTTRLQPKVNRRPTVATGGPPPAKSGGKIKITIKSKPDDTPEEAPAKEEPKPTKTMGPDDDERDIEIGFKQAKKTLGEE